MKNIFHVKIQLFVTRIQIRNGMDLAWFGSLDPDPDLCPHWGKKLDPGPDPNWNQCGSETQKNFSNGKF